jgi:hypothetical protein
MMLSVIRKSTDQKKITPRPVLEWRSAWDSCLIGTARGVQGGEVIQGRDEAGTYWWRRSIVTRVSSGQPERYVSLRIRAHDARRALFR